MTVAVNREQVRRIAELAELAVDDAAAAELERDLTRILDYVRQLDELDPGGTGVADEPAARLRADVPGPDPLRRLPPEFAPAMVEGLFVVPRPSEMGGAGGEP